MALTVALSIPSNIAPTPGGDALSETVYPDAYARILVIRSHAQESFLVAGWYENREARERGDAPIYMREFWAATSALSGDIYPAAYSYLKTLPEFDGATDC